MERPFTIKSEDMQKPLTLEQMQQFFKGGKKDVIDEINRKNNESTIGTNTKDNQCYIDKLGFSCGVEDVKYYEKITSLKNEQEQVLKTIGFLKNYVNITLEEQIKAEIGDDAHNKEIKRLFALADSPRDSREIIGKHLNRDREIENIDISGREPDYLIRCSDKAEQRSGKNMGDNHS